jgi:hypothetical protein
MADLRNVLSFQKAVSGGGEERIGTNDPHDLPSLFAFCLPPANQAQNMPGILDEGGKGVSFASPNPNLRVTNMQRVNANGQDFIGFGIGFGLPFVQVVEFQNRWFIRDGYHRSRALVASGIHTIPCIFIRARNAQEYGGDSPAFFRWNVVFGERPPFLSDFLDEHVAATVSKPIVGKIIRITAQEFNVQL